MPKSLYQNFLQFTRKQVSADAVGEAWARDMSIARLQDNVREAIRWAKLLGQQYVVLQMMWSAQMKTRTLVDEFRLALDLAGKQCSDEGLTFNFHNHADEFAPRDGYVLYQVILNTTNPALVKLELDLYWAVRAKADPASLLEQYRGRYTQCHIKDSTVAGDFAAVGSGIVDFMHILPIAYRSGARHFYVEYDRAADPMQVVRDAYRYLSQLPS